VEVNNYCSYSRCRLGFADAGRLVEPVSEGTNCLGQWRQWHAATAGGRYITLRRKTRCVWRLSVWARTKVLLSGISTLS